VPADSLPPWSSIAFELGLYAVCGYMLYTVWRGRRGELPLVLASMVFAGALEATDIRTTHSYYYTRELIMFGPDPDWFPLSIAVAWALVLHIVRVAGDRLAIAPWQRPAVAALLGLAIDLVLDPVVASARVVENLAQICDATDLPHGSAAGLGLWVWCVPRAEHSTIWGIPFANFSAWGVVVLVWGLVANAMRRLFRLPDGPTALDLRAVAYALATGAASFAIVWGVLQLYTPLVMHGVPEWVLLALPFAPGVLVLLLAGAARTDAPIDATTWLFPLGAMLYCLLGFVLDLVAGRGSLAFAVYVVLAMLGCMALIWWVVMGKARSLPRTLPLPSRAALLADAPARCNLQELAAVAALSDPTPRNYLITQAYHDLSAQLARVVGGPDANWCTFATWASRTAGESIRDEEAPAWALSLLRAEERLEHALEALGKALGEQGHPAPNVFDVARATLGRVRSQIGDGNRKVYAELSPLFARLIACWDGTGTFDDAAFATLVDGLRPGASADGGQAPVRQAFEAYRDAARERDATRKAQLMLLANALIGLHEQTRLQPNIADALDAPIDVADADGLWKRLAALLPANAHTELLAVLAPSSAVMLSFVRNLWCRIATSAAMHLELPDGSAIALGEDPNQSLRARYPLALRTPTLPALRDFIARYGAAHRDHADLGATDWANLDQRMRFIVDLFRTTQQDVRMFEQPFTEQERQRHAAVLGARADASSAVVA
jgi:hypothetical protein